MNIILLSGGSGKRLWPLSNEVRSKQFIKILKNQAGQPESMLQYIYRNLVAIGSTVDSAISSLSVQTMGYIPCRNIVSKQCGQERTEITIATSANQVSSIRSQLGDSVGISIEPCRRDTFPAMALATAYLHDVRCVGSDEAVVVCPVDPYVEDSYFKVIKQMYDLTSGDSMATSKAGKAGGTDIILMGIAPTYPSAKYGYIIPASTDTISAVSEFKEKPDVPTAEKYIELGAMWNGGVFAFKLSYLLNKAQALLGYSSYDELLANYAALPKISFDYAVVEKEPNVTVIRYAGAWKDLGTWNTLTEAMSEPVSGNAVAPLSVNTHVINELQIPLIALGVKDLAIAATPDGILVTDKKSSDKLKDYVSENRPMYEKRLWGEYKVLDIFSTATIPPAHNETGDNVGKTANSSHGIVAAQHSVGDKPSTIGESGDNICPNIRDRTNIHIQISKATAKTENTTDTDETAMSNLAGTIAGSNALTKHLIIKPGNHISYQLHRHRSEIWTFISGHGRLILDGHERIVTVGDVVKIVAGVKHGIIAISADTTADGGMGIAGNTDGALHIIEVQIGNELTEEDIERFDWPDL